jgi:predicted Fe-Mo cluster-binding NifX family protein
MKIAIPTDDGLTLAPQFTPSMAYLVLTLELGEIVHQEMRWNNPKKSPVSEIPPFHTIRDCSVVIVREIGAGPADVLKSQEKEIIRTNETIITSAFMHYLGSSYKKESNTCCCP